MAKYVNERDKQANDVLEWTKRLDVIIPVAVLAVFLLVYFVLRALALQDHTAVMM